MKTKAQQDLEAISESLFRCAQALSKLLNNQRDGTVYNVARSAFLDVASNGRIVDKVLLIDYSHKTGREYLFNEVRHSM